MSHEVGVGDIVTWNSRARLQLQEARDYPALRARVLAIFMGENHDVIPGVLYDRTSSDRDPAEGCAYTIELGLIHRIWLEPLPALEQLALAAE